VNGKLKVAEIIYSFDVESAGGGIARFGIELSKCLNPDQFDVGLVALWDRETQTERVQIEKLRSSGINACTATIWDEKRPYISFWRSFSSLRDKLSSDQVDIIHSHSEFSDVTALLLKVSLKSPKIMRTVHYGYQHEWRERPLRRYLLTNFLYPIMFHTEIGVSHAIVENLNHRRVANFLDRRAICIYNGLNLERFRNINVDIVEKKRSLGVPLESPLIGTVGRLTEQKGLSFMLNAAAIVLKHEPQATFIIVGDGELKQELRSLAISLQIDHRVIFTGARTDVDEILACLDLFVSSSLWEGLPTVILESMASHILVVATDIPGTKELIRDGYNGILVPPRNPDILAQSILTGLHMGSLKNDFIRRGFSTANTFSMEAISSEYEALYLRSKG
jgi:glycosyltransferase involved in cell wall biosynthesis